MDDDLSFLFDTTPELNFRGDRLDYLFRLEKGVERLSFDPLEAAERLYALEVKDEPSRAFPDVEGSWARERLYFGEHLEKLTKRSPQSLSDYRQAGKIAVTYATELERFGSNRWLERRSQHPLGLRLLRRKAVGSVRSFQRGGPC